VHGTKAGAMSRFALGKARFARRGQPVKLPGTCSLSAQDLRGGVAGLPNLLLSSDFYYYMRAFSCSPLG